MNFSFSSFPILENKIITYDLVQGLIEISPKRICFNSCHKDALRRDKKYVGKFVVPFKETIKVIFEQETGLTLFSSFGKYFMSINTEDDFKTIEVFVEKYKETVFLRDRLDLSMALSENITENDELTTIGQLEDSAKYKNDENSVTRLSEICASFINNTPFYNNADFICAVPPSDPLTNNLPRKVIEQLSNVKCENISLSVNWERKKQQLKELVLEQKWDALTAVNLSIKRDLKDKKIILVDDLYQSGTTMQYIAMKLKEAGSSHIFGLSFVKARNNGDYVR
ncbi:phosphoribosyltransferase [Mucilaginibacter panaciglaebae]|uniref:Phosphoribosyltransferase domain-containing protein n=1 Tax=Mucilaginibacter panaciglaebae TaxID=502331 RepID=A0ABP7WZK2_9SPHI